MKERISVAMATYNGGRFLREQLDSLYSQTRVPDEVVVCDDSSTDNTVEILEEYHQKYGLRYYVNKPNLGVNPNFFKVFSLCSGDYVFICDQDDIWLKDKIQKHYDVISKTDKTIPVAVSSSRTDVDASSRPIAEPIVKPYSDNWSDTLISTSASQGCTMLMNRCLVDKVLDLYNRHAKSNELMYDVMVSVTAAACGKKINIGIPLMYYRHHDANVIDKFRARKKTFADKVREMPQYYPFLMDYRVKELATVCDILEHEEINPEIASFLHKMKALYNTDNIIKGIFIVLSVPYLGFMRKLKIAVFTPVSFVLKKIIH